MITTILDYLIAGLTVAGVMLALVDLSISRPTRRYGWHTRAELQTGPPGRLRVVWLVAALLVGGCVQEPPQATVAPEIVPIERPSAWLMQAAAPLPDIPANDGSPAVRRDYYTRSRAAHSHCRAQVGGLQSWAGVVIGRDRAAIETAWHKK